MSGLESFDGKCGVIRPGSTSDQQVRCVYDFGHWGKHSWEKRESKGPLIMLVHESTLKTTKPT